MVLELFRSSLHGHDPIAALRVGLIGEGAMYEGPFGERRLTYADFTASGRALRQVEDFVAEHVLPYYANSHTESSFCGGYTTRLREEARGEIARITGAGPDCTVIFTGSGATAAINRAVALLGVAGAVRRGWSGLLKGKAARPLVLHGPYEHHSNILPWRESGAEVIEIPEGPSGGPDMAALEEALRGAGDRPMVIGTFSAASNVTGLLSDVAAVTRLLKSYGALALWDYAGGGPYLPIAMAPAADAEIDAIFLSPHKFVGGPGASGVLIIRNAAVHTTRPTWPGGGSVSYVSPWGHDYVANLAEREEAGTPNVIGDIRAALAMLVKEVIGTDRIKARDEDLVAKARARWADVPGLTVLEGDKTNRLPIFSFILKRPDGSVVHHHLVTRLLSDVYGIQARGGCACAGPYGHRLLHVARPLSERIRGEILAGHEIEKPGWTRLNLSYVMDETTVDFILDSVADLSRTTEHWLSLYDADVRSGQFHVAADKVEAQAQTA